MSSERLTSAEEILKTVELYLQLGEANEFVREQILLAIRGHHEGIEAEGRQLRVVK